MAMKVQYFSVDGEVIAESGASGYLSYHRDNLGSVCATLDSSGALVHQYQYKPFGELWSASGAGAQERRLQWCGSWGYSAIALTRKFLSYYVRARHYAAILGNWTSVDPLWPSEMAYGYVENRVMTGVDYWGRCSQVGPTVPQWIDYGRPTWVPPSSDAPKNELVSGSNKEPECDANRETLEALLKLLKAASVVAMILTPVKAADGSFKPEEGWNLDRLYDYKTRLEFSKECTEAHKRKGRLCDQKRSCKDITDCSQLRQFYENNIQCLYARFAMMAGCGRKNDKDWMCRHVAEFCSVAIAARSCGSALISFGCPGDVSLMRQTKHDCLKWKEACKGAKTKKGGDVPWSKW